MKDDQFDDLKQFIEATVSQAEVRLTERIDSLDKRVGSLDERVGSLDKRIGSVENKIDALDKKMEDGFAAAGDAIVSIHDHLEVRDKKVEMRLTHLENKVA